MSDLLGNTRITVDATSVEKMLAGVQRALQPSALERFLAGPVTAAVHEKAKQRFSGEGDDVVGRWVALAPYTQAQRRRAGFGPDGPILHRTGELERFITGSIPRFAVIGDGAAVELPGDGSGLDESKLKTAQQGRSPNPIEGFGPIPARPVMALGERDGTELTKLFGVWLEAELNAGGWISAPNQATVSAYAGIPLIGNGA